MRTMGWAEFTKIKTVRAKMKSFPDISTTMNQKYKLTQPARPLARSFARFFCWLVPCCVRVRVRVRMCGMAMSWFFMKNAFRYFCHIDTHTRTAMSN